jgi:hypothetical protein
LAGHQTPAVAAFDVADEAVGIKGKRSPSGWRERKRYRRVGFAAIFLLSAASREFRVDVNGKTSRRAKNCCGAHCKLAVANHFSISKIKANRRAR